MVRNSQSCFQGFLGWADELDMLCNNGVPVALFGSCLDRPSTLPVPPTSAGLRYSPKHITPVAARKAQVTQWLMYYRDNFFGVPTEDLLKRKQEAAQAAKRKRLGQLQERANALGVSLEEVCCLAWPTVLPNSTSPP